MPEAPDSAMRLVVDQVRQTRSDGSENDERPEVRPARNWGGSAEQRQVRAGVLPRQLSARPKEQGGERWPAE